MKKAGKMVRTANFQTDKYAASHVLLILQENSVTTIETNTMFWEKDSEGNYGKNFWRPSNNRCKMMGLPMKRRANAKKAKYGYDIEYLLCVR